MTARVQAVRVACLGETSLDHIRTKEYSTYNIKADHEIFTSTGELSALSILAGVPLMLMKLRPSLLTSSVIHGHRARGVQRNIKYGHSAEGSYFENAVARALMAGNEDSDARWSDQVGSILIARADQQPLHAGHIPMMVGFIEHATESIRSSQDASGAALSPGAFKAYYELSMQHLMASDQAEEWAMVPSPFADAGQSEDGSKIEVD